MSESGEMIGDVDLGADRDMRIELGENPQPGARIKVIGVGGGGRLPLRCTIDGTLVRLRPFFITRVGAKGKRAVSNRVAVPLVVEITAVCSAAFGTSGLALGTGVGTAIRLSPARKFWSV